jgi:PAS domain S-box-containing protein
LFRQQADSIRAEKLQALQAIASLKVDQLRLWRSERLRDAQLLATNPTLGRFLARSDQRDEAVAALALAYRALIPSDAVTGQGGYLTALLLDQTGRVLLATGTLPERRAQDDEAHEVLTQGRPLLGELYQCPACQAVHLDVLAPVMGSQGQVLGAVVLRGDPNLFLYPMVQSWPTPSRTAETLLVRRDGDQALLLNPLRHRAAAPLTLRVPLAHLAVPAVKAALGQYGRFEGQDYRGVEVLADLRPVANSTWSMVAKVDQDEILAEARYRAWVIALLVGLGVLLAAAAAGYLHRGRRTRVYQELYEVTRAHAQTLNEYRMALYSIGDGVISTDADGRVQRLNKEAERLTGWTEAAAQGQPVEVVFQIVSEVTGAGVDSPVRRVLRDGQVAALANHTLLIDRSGQARPIADSGAPIRDAAGAVMGAVLVFRDQTRERDAEQALVQAQRLRAMNEISTGISHNLNNLLTGVLLPAQMMRSMSLTPEAVEMVDEIITAGQRASDLVRRLHLSVRGDVVRAPDAVPLDQAVADAVATTRPRWRDEAEAHGVRIEVVSELAAPSPVQADPAALVEVVAGLILNAVTAMPQGGRLTLTTRCDADHAWLICADTGIGMDDEVRRRVFEPFFTTKTDVGSGLGLSTAHAAVTSWGGTIEVTSAPGAGATFTLQLPLWRPTASVVPSLPAVTSIRGRVLIVDDDEAVRRVLTRLLEPVCETSAVPGALEALAVLQPGRWDVWVIDLGMPDMPGDRLRQELVRQDPAVVTVLLSGWDLETDDPRRAGFDLVLAKPLTDRRPILAAVELAARRRNEHR